MFKCSVYDKPPFPIHKYSSIFTTNPQSFYLLPQWFRNGTINVATDKSVEPAPDMFFQRDHAAGSFMYLNPLKYDRSIT